MTKWNCLKKQLESPETVAKLMKEMEMNSLEKDNKDHVINSLKEDLHQTREKYDLLQKEYETNKIQLRIDDSLENFEYIYIKYIKDSLNIYLVDLCNNTNDKYNIIYKTTNVKKIRNLLYSYLDSYKISYNTFALNYDILLNLFKYCVNVYDHYKINNDIDLSKYLTRFTGDCTLLQNQQIDELSVDIIEEYVAERIEYKDKVALCQIQEDFYIWYSDKYNIDLVSSKNVIKTKLLENISRITNIEKSNVNISDKAKNINLSKYVGFVGIRIKQDIGLQTYMYDKKIYEEFIDSVIFITKDK